jgi:hypothetical protein
MASAAAFLFAAALPAHATDDEFAFQLGTILGSESFCGLSFDQAAIQALIEKKVSADDLQFAGELSIMTDGTKALFRGVVHGRRAGERGYSSAFGLPPGLTFRGESKLHVNWQSFAQLTVSGDGECVRACGARFAEALAVADVRREPDGIAVEALEGVLTELCWYQEAMDDEQAAPLLPAVHAVPPDRPAGASLRFPLACIHLAQKNATAAAPLLKELAQQGKSLAFSHGIVCGRAPSGLPAMVAWQDQLPAAGAYYEVLSAQALVAELGGQKAHAVSLYRTIADAKVALTSEEAGKQLARLD